MPFITDDEQSDFEDNSQAFKERQAMQESARNVLQALHNDIANPKMFIQTVDEETGMLTAKRLVQGGIEYFNDHQSSMPNAAEYNIDAILTGEVSVEDAMAMLDSPPHENVMPPKENTVDMFRVWGLEFLKATPVMPNQQVLIRITGTAEITVPMACHHIVLAEELVVLVTDKRTVPVTDEMNFNIDRKTSQAELALPDGATVPVLAPVPRTISFDLGILHCTLFVRENV